jgi:DNA-binding XRE family transcriptional regulator
MTVQGARPRILTPALCRGARGLLDWSQSDLAERAEVSRSTIKDFEAGAHELHRATETQVLRALAAGGVAIHPVEGLGTGLFLVSDRSEAVPGMSA